jgi:rhamnose utilization protein RhaD (predicted bifunctional aldolase and dehydrogenase)
MNTKNKLRSSVEELCHHIGKDHLIVQGAGGNVSWKQEGRLAIKASGKWLSKAKEEDIFVFVDLDSLKRDIKKKQFDTNPELSIQSRLRPSIETTMHALMPHKIVLHVHAVEPLAYLVREDCEEELRSSLDPNLEWIIVDYVKPGALLASAINDALLRKPDANIIFLRNHGIVVGAETSQEILSLIEAINKSLSEKQFPVKTSHSGSLNNSLKGYQLIQDSCIQNLALSSHLYSRLDEYWVLYPDHAVFLGPHPFTFESINNFLIKSKEYIDMPELIFIKDVGVFSLISFDRAKIEQLRCYSEVLMRQKESSRIRSLDKVEIAELLNWDAEKYRIDISNNNH